MSLQKKIMRLVNKRGVIPDIPLANLNPLQLSKLIEEVSKLYEAYEKTGYIDTYELADVAIVLFVMADYNYIDLEDAMLEKAHKDVNRRQKR
jgi:NTP pyrophosphatase (non-canonical NTP hydrolase)